MCIAEGALLGDRRRPRMFTEEQYFKTQAEMVALFADIPEALVKQRGDCQALYAESGVGQEQAAAVSYAGRHDAR